MGSSGSSMGIRIPNAILALASPNRNPRIALGETPARLARGPGDGDWRRHHPAPPRRPPSRRAHRESIDCRQRWLCLSSTRPYARASGAWPRYPYACRQFAATSPQSRHQQHPSRSPERPPARAPTTATAASGDTRAKSRGWGDPYHEFPLCVGAPNGGNTRYGYPLAALVLAEAGAARASRGAVAIMRKTHGGCFNVFVIMRQGTRIMIPLH